MEAQAKTITLTLALLPIIWMTRVVIWKSPTAVFVSQTRITKEFQFSKRWKQFPFFGAGQCRHHFLDVGLSVVSDLRFSFSLGYCSDCGRRCVFLQAADLRFQLCV